MKPVFWGAFLSVMTTVAGCVDGIDCITVNYVSELRSNCEQQLYSTAIGSFCRSEHSVDKALIWTHWGD